MAQVPFAVADQVLEETQQLARWAKEYSGLTNAEIEQKLLAYGVVSDKGGAHFSELMNGKVSKAHGLTNFREALEKAELLPSHQNPATFPEFERTTALARTTSRCDWQQESRKAAAVVKATEKAARALNELAEAMEDGPKFYYALLNNFYLEMTAKYKEDTYPSSPDQVREFANWLETSMSECLRAASGWDYSNRKTGAKVVQLEHPNDAK